MNLTERITINARVMGGKPCIRGMRVTVGTVVGRVAAGLSMADWPEGTDRALSFSFRGHLSGTMGSGSNVALRDELGVEHWLDSLREADAFSFEVEGD